MKNIRGIAIAIRDLDERSTSYLLLRELCNTVIPRIDCEHTVIKKSGVMSREIWERLAKRYCEKLNRRVCHDSAIGRISIFAIEIRYAI